jgi:hypothetical protein
MFRVPWGPEIHACAHSQHKLDFQHSTFLKLKFCVENFHNLEKSMSYAFSISHVMLVMKVS